MKKQGFRNLAPPLLTLLLLAGMAYAQYRQPKAVAAERWREAMHAVVRSLPAVRGEWVGQRVVLPESAVNSFSDVESWARLYENVQTGSQVQMAVVWTTNQRDLQSFTSSQRRTDRTPATAPRPVNWADRGVSIPSMVYELPTQPAFPFDQPVVTCSYVVMPSGMVLRDLAELELVQTEDETKSRPLGVAMIELAFPGNTPRLEQQRIVQTLMLPAVATIAEAGSGDSL